MLAICASFRASSSIGSSGGLIISTHTTPYLFFPFSNFTFNSHKTRNENFLAYFVRILNFCVVGWSLFGKFGKLYGNRVKFVPFSVKNYLCKISQRKIDVHRLHMSSEISWVIPSQLNQCFHVHHLRFCSKLHQMCPCGRNEKSPRFRSKLQAVYILWPFKL